MREARPSDFVTWCQTDQSRAFFSHVRRASDHVTRSATHVGAQRASFFVLGLGGARLPSDRCRYRVALLLIRGASLAV